MPSKKDRAKINELREEIKKTTEEIKHKAKQHKLIEKNLLKKVDDLNLRQKTLSHELKLTTTEEGKLSKAKVTQSRQAKQQPNPNKQTSPRNSLETNSIPSSRPSLGQPKSKTSKVAQRYDAYDQ